MSSDPGQTDSLLRKEPMANLSQQAVICAKADHSKPSSNASCYALWTAELTLAQLCAQHRPRGCRAQRCLSCAPRLPQAMKLKPFPSAYIYIYIYTYTDIYT